MMRTKNTPSWWLMVACLGMGLVSCGDSSGQDDHSAETAGDHGPGSAGGGGNSDSSGSGGRGNSGGATAASSKGGRGGSSTTATGGGAGTAAGGASGSGGRESTGTAGATKGAGGAGAGAAGAAGGSYGQQDAGRGAGGSSDPGAGGSPSEPGAPKDAGTGDGSDATYVPDSSWTCGMAEGIPSPTSGTLVFRATLELGDIQDVGATQYGHRRVLDIKGGKFTGNKASGSFLTGGFDFELTLANGAIEVESINVLKASDGTVIFLRSCGVAPDGASEVRLVPDFEVATDKSALAFLNTGKFVATRVVDKAKSTMQFDVYDVSQAKAGERIPITKPADGTPQPWNCATQTGAKGASVFTENVTLGSSLSVGRSDKGSRNIIPITGGTTSGKLTGKIVPGGGDYQFTASGGTTSLDAKYVLAPSDGEFVVVRNCGPMGKLIPQFEARADGPYAFLNANTFVSSDPGAGSGGVSITFHERK